MHAALPAMRSLAQLSGPWRRAGAAWPAEADLGLAQVWQPAANEPVAAAVVPGQVEAVGRLGVFLAGVEHKEIAVVADPEGQRKCDGVLLRIQLLFADYPGHDRR
jgi:hypothetical protein